ncbi:MAG: HAD-IA family hydrolase [Candidatus Saccharimonadales bacterium]
MIKAVIFDCFGVLVSDALSVMVDVLPVQGRQRVIDLMHASHHGLGSSIDSSKQIAALLGMTVPEYSQAIQDDEVKNEQLMNYIGQLKKQYKMAILSNISVGGITRRFTTKELEVFDTVVASGEVGYAKPEPEIYEIAATRLGVRFDECVFTDDREEYCEAARAIGMRAILYKDFDQFRAELETVLKTSV